MADINEGRKDLDLANKNVKISNEDISKALKNMDKDVSAYVDGKAKEYGIDVDGLDTQLKIQKVSLAAAQKGKTSDFNDKIGEDIKENLLKYYEVSVVYANQKYSEAVEQISQLKQEIQEKVEQKKQLAEEKQKNIDEISELFEQAKASQKELKVAQTELDDIKSQIDSFDTTNKYKKLTAEDLEERNELIDSLNSKKEKYDSLTNKNKDISSKVESLKNKNSEISKALDGMKDIDSKSKQIQELEGKYAEYFKNDKEKTENLKKDLNDRGIKVEGSLKEQFIDILSGKKAQDKEVEEKKPKEETARKENPVHTKVVTDQNGFQKSQVVEQPKTQENLPIENPKEKVLNFLNLPEKEQKKVGIDSIIPDLMQLGISGDKLNHSQKKQLRELSGEYEEKLINIRDSEKISDVDSAINSAFKGTKSKNLDDIKGLFNLNSDDSIMGSYSIYRYMGDDLRSEINSAVKNYYKNKENMDPKEADNIEKHFIAPLKYTVAMDSINQKSMSTLYKFADKINSKDSKFYSKDSKNYEKDANELNSIFTKNPLKIDIEDVKKDEKSDSFMAGLKGGVESKHISKKYATKEAKQAEKER